jgi:hypothetical protein
MKKTPSLFMRNYDGDRLVRDEIVPGSEWVVQGEGVATRKWDGTCCMVRDGKLYKRYDAKKGKKPPADFEPAMDPDPITGHWAGWVPVKADDPGSKWHFAAWEAQKGDLTDGTYELCGPHFQGNPERFTFDTFVRHGSYVLPNCPRTFEGIKEFLGRFRQEGIVWHHPDGRMVKIKARDFGLEWPRKQEQV